MAYYNEYKPLSRSFTNIQIHTMNINSNSSILSVILIAIIGPCVFIVQPGFVQALIDNLQYNEVQAGAIASFENAGLATATVIIAFIIQKIPWVRVVKIALFLSALGNLLTVFVQDFTLFATLRFITALGSGTLIALSFAMLSTTVKTDRNFAALIILLLLYGGLGLFFMPSALDHLGLSGVLIFFTLFNLSGLLVLQNLPNNPVKSDVAKDLCFNINFNIRIITLTALLLYNIAIGIVWVYLFVVGVNTGMSEQSVANALMVSQFAGILGASIVLLLQNKFGRTLPLLVSIWGGALGVALLIAPASDHHFWIGVCIFNGLWNLAVPYFLAVLSEIDDFGYSVTQGTAMQFIGYAVGPFIASVLVATSTDDNSFELVYTIAVAIFVLSGIGLLPILKQLRKTN